MQPNQLPDQLSSVERDLHGVPKPLGPHGQPTPVGCECWCCRPRRYDAEGRPLCFVCGRTQSEHPGGTECSPALDEESAKAHAAAEKWCSICRRITDHDAGAHYRGEARTGAASPRQQLTPEEDR